MSSTGNVDHLSQPCIYGVSERRSWFTRWLSKLFKGGSGNRALAGGTHHPPQFIGDESMVLRAPVRSLDMKSWVYQDNHARTDRENEELDRAIALSLSEGLKKPNGYGWRPNNEDDRAKAVQDDLRLTHPKCEVCFQFIPTNGAGLIEYRCHPFWSQKYCPVHEHDNTTRCCSCERLESVNGKYTSLGDGRSLCLECMESAIMDTGDCQPLYHSIRDYYEGMNMKLDQQIPMLLVERQALNEAIVGEKHGFHHMPETRGLCLSEEQIVLSILKRPKIRGQGLIGMRSQPHKLTRRCEVTAILVLYGLPRLLTGAILVQELMHGWLRLKGYRNLNPEVEEGICQVLSYMWLESEIMPRSTSTSAGPSSSFSSVSKKGGKSRVENKLGELFMHQIAHDASPAYGGGFRAANAAVNTYGLRRTLDHIRLTGSFPL